LELLLHDVLAPITSEIGFLECELSRAVDSFVQWTQPIQQQRGVHLTCRESSGTLEEKLRSLLPLTSVEARRFLFVPTKSKWVAFFDNGHQGCDCVTPMAYLARTISCRAVRVAAVPNKTPKLKSGRWRGRYGAVILDLFDSEVKDYSNTRRSISVINDGGRWRFVQIGEPLPFEDTQIYSAKRIADRFPFEHLVRYLRHLGLEPFDERFYSDPGVLIEKHGPNATGLREYSLEEVRADL
jgi:hypothetical protein